MTSCDAGVLVIQAIKIHVWLQKNFIYCISAHHFISMICFVCLFVVVRLSTPPWKLCRTLLNLFSQVIKHCCHHFWLLSRYSVHACEIPVWLIFITFDCVWRSLQWNYFCCSLFVSMMNKLLWLFYLYSTSGPWDIFFTLKFSFGLLSSTCRSNRLTTCWYEGSGIMLGRPTVQLRYMCMCVLWLAHPFPPTNCHCYWLPFLFNNKNNNNNNNDDNDNDNDNNIYK